MSFGGRSGQTQAPSLWPYSPAWPPGTALQKDQASSTCQSCLDGLSQPKAPK